MLWYAAGSTVAGAGLGAAMAALGSLARHPLGLSPRAAIGALALVLVAGVALDLGVRGTKLPTFHRQVNEEWLYRYRGWLYGLGFGVQLGAGFATVVVISAVYGTFAAAFLSGSIHDGLLIGAAFGLVRAGSILWVASVRRTPQLVTLDALLRRWDGPSRRLAIATEAALLAVALAAALT